MLTYSEIAKVIDDLRKDGRTFFAEDLLRWYIVKYKMNNETAKSFGHDCGFNVEISIEIEEIHS